MEGVGYSVWWDTQLLAGQDFQHTIPAVLEEARCAIVVWSTVSVERQWVRAEAYRANEREILVPVRIDQVRIPLPFNLLHAEDMKRWSGKPDDPVFRRLLGALARHCPLPKPTVVGEIPPKPAPTPDHQPPKWSITGRLAMAGIAIAATTAGSYVYLNDSASQQSTATQSLAAFTTTVKQSEPVPKPVAEKSVPTPVSVALPKAEPPVAASKDLIAGRYIDHGNGTITDTQTRLMWKKCREGQSGNACSGEASRYQWNDAMSRFKGGVSFAGYSDWRMPTKEELRSLVYCSNGTPASVAWDNSCDNGGKAGEYQRPTINLQAFPNTPGWYWSSTPNDASYAWGVYFPYGSDGWYDRDSAHAVRLVRSGQ